MLFFPDLFSNHRIKGFVLAPLDITLCLYPAQLYSVLRNSVTSTLLVLCSEDHARRQKMWNCSCKYLCGNCGASPGSRVLVPAVPLSADWR